MEVLLEWDGVVPPDIWLLKGQGWGPQNGFNGLLTSRQQLVAEHPNLCVHPEVPNQHTY